jgi:hypothetical protein
MGCHPLKSRELENNVWTITRICRFSECEREQRYSVPSSVAIFAAAALLVALDVCVHGLEGPVAVGLQVLKVVQ